MSEDVGSVAIPDTLRELMAEIGPRWGTDVSGHVRLMIDAFTQVLAGAPKRGVQIGGDIPYGEHSRQRLDVYKPEHAKSRPVVLFVHGGAFVDGERNRSAEVYANVLYYFARHGVVGVNVEYRLAPEFQFPSGIEDVRRALEWTRANIGEFGGDQNRIFLMGHSAGAAHAAGYAYDARYQPDGGPGVAGLIVVSGRVRADNTAANPNARKVEAYYGSDATRYDDRSPVSFVDANSIRTLIAFAEFENPLIDVYCLELAYKLAVAKGRSSTVLRLPGHNHTSMIAHLNTSDERLGREILAFIDAPGAG
jgi:acetyl esterase